MIRVNHEASGELCEITHSDVWHAHFLRPCIKSIDPTSQMDQGRPTLASTTSNRVHLQTPYIQPRDPGLSHHGANEVLTTRKVSLALLATSLVNDCRTFGASRSYQWAYRKVPLNIKVPYRLCLFSLHHLLSSHIQTLFNMASPRKRDVHFPVRKASSPSPFSSI